MQRQVVGWLGGIFAASLLMLLGSTRPGGAADDKVGMTFSNDTDGDVELLWLDSNGKEKSYGVVKKDASQTVQTFKGHVWVLRGTKGQELMRHTVTSNPGQAEVFNLAGPQDKIAAKPATGSAVTAQEANDLVAFHNKARKEVGVGTVKWSPELAKYAQEWADELARNGKFEHRPLPLKYGECLAAGSGNSYTVLTGAQNWYDEKKDYTPGTEIPRDFSKFKAGHYTQMVWKDVTEIGSGKAVCATGDMKGWLIHVCCYNPCGNVIGKTPY